MPQIKAIFLTLIASLLIYSGATWATRGEIVHLTEADLRETHSLKGHWQFRPGDDLNWLSPDYDDGNWAAKRIPERWANAGFPETGQFAWYRITLEFDPASPGHRDYLSYQGVRIGKILSAYELYAGGELLGGVGKLPPLSEVNYDLTRVYPIPPSAISADGTLVLALRIWGGSNLAVSNWGGGPHESEFLIGNYAELLQARYLGELPGIVFCVLFFGFGFYHLYLYQRNRQLGAYLWYGLMALDIGVYGLMSNQLRYRLDWSFATEEKIEFSAIYIFPALLIQMLWSLIELPIGRLLRIYQFSFVVLMAMVVLAPGLDILYYTLRPFEILALPFIFFLPWVIIRETRAGNAEARTALIGMLIFMATAVNDIMIDLARWETVRLLPLGFVAIMLSMAISLANRFTSVLNNLEGEVAQRTTELSVANLKLEAAARRDPLTTVLNRRGFIDEAEAEMQRFFRTGREFSIVLSDLDHFKTFNDQYGHACGAYVLQEVANILDERVRDMDAAARWGGEEFILMLPETSSEGAFQVAEKLRGFIENKRFEFERQQLGVTMTFGIATYRKGETLDNCIARADAALYEGKEKGRNRVTLGKHPGLSLIG